VTYTLSPSSQQRFIERPKIIERAYNTKAH
jgi:hypothetical protein